MKIYRPSDTCFDEMKSRMNRRALPEDSVRDTVNAIIQDVSARGDEALFDYASRFDKVHLDSSSLFVTEAELAEAEAMVEGSVKEAIAVSLANIHYFSDRSRRQDWSGVNAQGVEVAERFLPYDRVGIYIPGGKAPLVSTSIMTGGFAQAAGVREIVAATPCGPDGRVNPALVCAESLRRDGNCQDRGRSGDSRPCTGDGERETGGKDFWSRQPFCGGG